jgi:hypothetical protein
MEVMMKKNLASKTVKTDLVAHLNGVQVVGGSNPPIPTIFCSEFQIPSFFYFGNCIAGIRK